MPAIGGNPDLDSEVLSEAINRMKRRSILTGLILLGSLSGCISVKTHSTVDPIYMTLDVNLKVQLQRELTDAFGAIDAASDTMIAPAAPAASGS